MNVVLPAYAIVVKYNNECSHHNGVAPRAFGVRMAYINVVLLAYGIALKRNGVVVRKAKGTISTEMLHSLHPNLRYV